MVIEISGLSGFRELMWDLRGVAAVISDPRMCLGLSDCDVNV